MKHTSTRLLAISIGVVSIGAASPREELASPDPTVRYAAAAAQRRFFKSSPKSKWTPIIAKISNGQSEDQIQETLRPINATLEGSSGMGASDAEGHLYSTQEHSYRLDEAWVLQCHFLNDKLASRKLAFAPKVVEVDPPKNFTGRWVTYLINGQKCKEDDYINGRRHGLRIINYYDGSRLVQEYQNDMPDGEERYFYPSGISKESYRLQLDTQLPKLTTIEDAEQAGGCDGEKPPS